MFQFHFGSIGSSNGFGTSALQFSCFNSTLVRLEVTSINNRRMLSVFQFHFGSIGRINDFVNSPEITVVSIPLWFDWKYHSNLSVDKITMFQFHFGSIGSNKQYLFYHLSILFQFHFGSIGRLFIARPKSSLFRFNSTLVRLEARTKSKRNRHIKFQFHFGSIGRINEAKRSKNS